MKRNVITTTAAAVICTVILANSVWAAANQIKYSRNFIKNFKDCDKYEETVNSTFEGKTFTTVRQIRGWQNSGCNYTEIIKSNEGEYRLDCKLSSMQLDDLYDAMKSRSKEITRQEINIFAEQKDPKTGQIKYVNAGTSSVKGNKAYIAWTKIQNNPYFCKPVKIR